jgi:hypothetical protein
MSNARIEHTQHGTSDSGELVRYPTNQVVAVIETPAQVLSVFETLCGAGYAAEDVAISCGSAAADAVRANTGATGLSALTIRLFESLGIQDGEMTGKAEYEQALYDGYFVMRVAAGSERRKDIAVRILRDHGADAIRHFGRLAIELIVPRRTI